MNHNHRNKTCPLIIQATLLVTAVVFGFVCGIITMTLHQHPTSSAEALKAPCKDMMEDPNVPDHFKKCFSWFPKSSLLRTKSMNNIVPPPPPPSPRKKKITSSSSHLFPIQQAAAVVRVQQQSTNGG